MNTILTFVKEVCRETLLIVFYALLIFLPAALLIGSCNALIEMQIDSHKLWDRK